MSQYVPPDNDYLRRILTDLKETAKTFLFCIRGYPRDLEYSISEFDMLDIIIRVDKRQTYYKYFHNNMTINEFKTAGLLAYWILKFKPITITDSRYCNNIEHCDNNELFAFYIMWLAVYQAGRCNMALSGKERFVQELRYSFRFRMFTIDALIVLAETLNETALNQR